MEIQVGNLNYKFSYLQKKKVKMQSQGFSPTYLEINNLSSNNIENLYLVF